MDVYYTRNWKHTGSGLPDRMAFILFYDKWDDFGYATLFSARLFFRGKMLFLGNVRLYYEGESTTWRFIEKFSPRRDTDLIPLPRDHRYIALGSNLDFYKRLVRHAGHTRAREVLLDLHDVALLRAERPEAPDLRLVNDDAYKTSLVRDRPEVDQVLESAQPASSRARSNASSPANPPIDASCRYLQ